jgi:glutathione S-transferase
MSSYALYYYDQCPFCQMVLREMRKTDVQIELMNTLTNPQNRQDLIQGGGKGTVPCLKITTEEGRESWMYESGDIAQFIKGL